jgi:hypothetical protein
MKRHEAYRWLAEKLGITKAQCHIGMFTARQCDGGGREGGREEGDVSEHYPSEEEMAERAKQVSACGNAADVHASAIERVIECEYYWLTDSDYRAARAELATLREQVTETHNAANCCGIAKNKREYSDVDCELNAGGRAWLMCSKLNQLRDELATLRADLAKERERAESIDEHRNMLNGLLIDACGASGYIGDGGLPEYLREQARKAAAFDRLTAPTSAMLTEREAVNAYGRTLDGDGPYGGTRIETSESDHETDCLGVASSQLLKVRMALEAVPVEELALVISECRNGKKWRNDELAEAVKDRLLAAIAEPAPRLEYEDCASCRGYGHFAKHGKPSIDKRDRRCLDCNGEGRVPRTPTQPPENPAAAYRKDGGR